MVDHTHIAIGHGMTSVDLGLGVRSPCMRTTRCALEVLSAVRDGARADTQREPLAAVREPRARLPQAAARSAPGKGFSS